MNNYCNETYYIQVDFGPNFSQGHYTIEARNKQEALILLLLRIENDYRDFIKNIYFI